MLAHLVTRTRADAFRLGCHGSPAELLFHAGRANFGSKKAAHKRAIRLRMRRTRTPPKALRQRDGDFPITFQPAPETRDLTDPSLHAEESTPVDPQFRHQKPHKVREMMQAIKKRPNLGTPQDKPMQPHKSRIRGGNMNVGDIPMFDLEKDISEEHSADMNAAKARARARRNYKWMPNPFGPKPGDLGPSPQAEAKYYQKYFDGSHEQRHRSDADAEELRDHREKRSHRERISPRAFWYRPDYITPAVADVAFMNSRDLKFAMVNEAHLVRIWRRGDGAKSGAKLPPGNGELWMAFGYRALSVALGRSQARLGAPSGGYDESGEKVEKNTPCSLLTTLRFLQCLASVQAGPYTALMGLVHVVLKRSNELRPWECFYLLQALSRLRLKHPRCGVLLERLSLTWKVLPEKKFVMAANAVAKLDMASSTWARPLKVALVEALPRLSGGKLANLKAITVMELLDSGPSMTAYLEHCFEHRADFVYLRHLQMVEVHFHLLYPEAFAALSEEVRLFLQEVREMSHATGQVQLTESQASATSDSECDGDTDRDSDSDTDAESNLAEQAFDRRVFSSLLHADISRTLKDVLGIEHQNKIAAACLSLDICHLSTMTVVEAAERWQFYLRSAHLTSQARRRLEILEAMGFTVVRVPFHEWSNLETDEQKARFLRERLPSKMLATATPVQPQIV